MSAQSRSLGIVVGVDGSPPSNRALDWAAREAALRRLPLTLVHAAPTVNAQNWIDVPVPVPAGKVREDVGNAILTEAAALATDALGPGTPIVIDRKLLFDSPVPALVGLSEDADMVVVGCRGLGALTGIVLGSVSRGLVHHAHCPVAVIQDQDSPVDDPAAAPVVVGIDGSPASVAAIDIAFEEASRRGVDLVAVHACSDDDPMGAEVGWDELETLGAEVLSEQLAGRGEQYPDVTVRRVLMRTSPARWIVEQADRAQLVVVGSHGRGGFTGMLLGSVGNSVVQAARVPVIIARQS